MKVRALTWARAKISAAVGVTAETRREGVKAMLYRHGRDRVGYWLPLLLSLGIATYGLVLGSTGVVIGAMLVSPLMGPLVEIGMGLVVGSPLLVLHAVLRTTASVAVVVLLSGALTRALPYYEVNAEILARTAPTLLDLYVAALCAVAAAYTTVRKGSDTVTAAAGTAISIALVPPLCVIGWGLASGNAQVWRGATLLFTANFCAILLFAVLAFGVLAYDTVDVIDLEREIASSPSRVDRLALHLRHAFGSKYGPLLRFLMPVVLVASIFVPLRRALNEVAWTVRTRAAVQRILDELPAAKRAVRSVVTVERHAVAIRLILLSDDDSSKTLKADLEKRLTAASGVTPRVDILTVPDADALRLAAESAAVPPVVAEVPRPDLPAIHRELDRELRRRWPASAAGDLTAWHLVVGDSVQTVEVVHFGEPLGAAGATLLGQLVTEPVGYAVSIRDVALSTEVVASPAKRGLEWLPAFSRAIDQAVASGVAFACVTTPPPGYRDEERARTVAQVAEQLRRLAPTRSTISQNEQWSVALSPAPCPTPESPRDAGTD